MKNIILILSIFFLIISPVFSFGKTEKSEQISELKKAETLWEKKGSDRYKISLLFKGGNFPANKITIWVSPDNTEWESDNQISPELINTLTVKGLFDRVKKSTSNNKKSVFRINAQYNSKTGYVEILTRMPSKEALSSGRFPRDANYRIEVIELRQGERR
jgi:hypothetical protein